MTLYQVLSLLGAGGLLVGVFRLLFAQIKGVRLGVQALLRAQMIADYNKWSERGYAPIYARENFTNCWTQYHSLGVNGVMDDLKAKFLALPTDHLQAEKGDLE